MTRDDIELSFIREFSMAGNLIGKTASRVERRERVRQAIYLGARTDTQFYDSGMTYAEAFRTCYGERLDRRAATRVLPDLGEAWDDAQGGQDLDDPRGA